MIYLLSSTYREINRLKYLQALFNCGMSVFLRTDEILYVALCSYVFFTTLRSTTAFLWVIVILLNTDSEVQVETEIGGGLYTDILWKIRKNILPEVD